MDPQVLDRYLEFALATAQLGGRAVLPYYRTALEIHDKGLERDYQPATLADREGERVMREHIEQHYPNHAISGEEFGWREGSARYTWYIDPIDGTRSFVLGLLHWATMLALSDEERPLVGVVHQPFVNESFVAKISGMAYRLHGGVSTALATRRCTVLSQACVTTSDPQQFMSARERAVFEKLVASARDVRFGAECYGACMLAAGLVDIVVEVGLDVHDVQPLIPIIEAAGGVITDWEGGPCYGGGSILACGDAALHAALLRFMA